MNDSEKAIEMLRVQQQKNGAEVFRIEMTKQLIRCKCNKCFCAVFVSVSQEDAEKIASIFKIKDSIKSH